MFDSLKLKQVKLKIFSTITSAFIIFLIIFINASLHFQTGFNRRTHLQIHQSSSRFLKITSEDDDLGGGLRVRVRVQPENNLKPEELQMFDPRRNFDSRVRNFFTTNHCTAQIFMTWISSLDSFGQREFFGLETLFHTNPTSCLIILSNSMDSDKGFEFLAPLTRRGYRIRAMAPDLYDLVKNTATQTWLDDIKNGNRTWGAIPLAQNLSNLIRLAVLYRYGGVYLDTDFIILKDISKLRNSIGAQSMDASGNWSRLNNAVLIFDKNHPLVYRFLDEFATTFDGNKWGHNGPYLVSRVVNRVAKTGEYNFTILPPVAFYPIYWTKVARFFTRPNDRVGAKWVEAKTRQLIGSSYGVHLWNKQSSRLKIEEGSIIGRLISDHCIVCNHPSLTIS